MTQMAYEAPAVPKGWRTKKEWMAEGNIPRRTFEDQLSRLIQLGHAKKSRFTNPDGMTNYYYWINNLSDEDHG